MNSDHDPTTMTARERIDELSTLIARAVLRSRTRNPLGATADRTALGARAVDGLRAKTAPLGKESA
jgi:hypothetical protein